MEVKKFNQISEEEKPVRYMFFNNLKTIKHAIDEMLEYDEEKLDKILQEHDWAVDHIATSTDDIEEVYHFFEAHLESEDHEDEDEDEDND